MFARFENGLIAEVDSTVQVGDEVRAYVISYDYKKKCYFTSKVTDLLEIVSQNALFTDKPDLPIFEVHEENESNNDTP